MELKYPDKPWNWNVLFGITIDIIEKYPHIPWDWNELSQNSRITIDIEKYIDKPWNWSMLTYNIPNHVIVKYPYKPWDQTVD